MGLWEKVQAHKGDILRLAEIHGASNIRIFGSVARREDGPDSDIDFLVEMGSDRSLLDRAGLLGDLEELFGLKVDVTTEKSLKPRIKERVMKEAIPL